MNTSVSNYSAALPTLSGASGLASYLAAIAKFPMLTFEKEQELATRYYEGQDEDAAKQLVMSHLRLAAKTAFTFRHYGLQIADLISEANLGLIQAVKKFDPTKGFRFATYAVWWIKANLHDFVLKSWSLVKMGSAGAQKRLFYNLSKIKSKLGIYSEKGLSDQDATKIAHVLDASKEDVIDMNARLSGDQSLNVTVGDDSNAQRQDFLADLTPTIEETLIERQEATRAKQKLAMAMAVLNPREQEILSKRRLKDEPDTLETLSREYGISRERVRQIEERAFGKIKEELLKAA